MRSNSDGTNKSKPYSIDYGALFLEGVKKEWAGSFGGFEVSTHALADSNGIGVLIGDMNKNSIACDYSFIRAPSSGWTPNSPGSIVIWFDGINIVDHINNYQGNGEFIGGNEPGRMIASGIVSNSYCR